MAEHDKVQKAMVKRTLTVRLDDVPNEVAIVPISKPYSASVFSYAGWCVVVSCALVRCLVTPEPFPYWDIDPGHVSLPVTGVTPAISLGIDAAMLFACGVALWGQVLSGMALLAGPLVLWLIGSIGVLVHGLVLRAGTVDDLRIGATWIAAMGGGVTAMHVCRDAALKRCTLAAAIGIIAILTCKGAVQVYYEHAMTVARYRVDRDAFLESQGWLPGSTAAKNFERRLNQPEATGWFGLANVFATFAAMSSVALVGCAILAWREARQRQRMPDGWAGVISLGAAASFGALMFSGSKGGFTVAGIGLAALAGIMLLGPTRIQWLKRWGGSIAVALVLAAILAVALRGLIGERFGELSLLFRWFYLQGAVRTVVHDPVFGTGPDGFKNAYMLFKPALSPEEVSSPHSIVFDFAATLGVFGVLWGVLWVSWVRGAGRNLASSTEETAELRPELRVLALSLAAALLASTWMERSLGSPDQALLRVVGFGAWLALSYALLCLFRISSTAMTISALTGIVAAIHCQIEVTAIWSSSTCYIAVVLGACAASQSTPRIASRWAVAGPIAMIALAATIAWGGVRPALRWESALRSAAGEMNQLAEVRARLAELASGRPPSRVGDSLNRLCRDLATLTNAPAPTNERELQQSVLKLTHDALLKALAAFEAQRRSAHFGTVEAICRLHIELAGACAELGDETEMERQVRLAQSASERLSRISRSPNSLGLYGNTLAAASELLHEPALAREAVQAWEAASTLDPYGVAFPLRIFNTLTKLQDRSAARPWAKRVLELNDLQRLDPLKQLSDAELQAIRGALKE